ncbi:carboxypeptidase-like regulatory domain-containing protein [Mucilaginibacter sp. E4BP6]|uniref:carboxypeptidase-like regulatory domain-containing protein n=1 Tax=Mucilaginibacter sp. E4BP6 TaxID=2723089 RepID=UPI0015CE2025|nr:carboxypeptidase-like regulatory domain-containing protein [Mucilaginibacter sp. E4BP6]NYE68491.1 hypothetical protein [Mucilaginibacter sp. E4BP6]
MFKYLTIFLIFIAFNSNAQYTITGNVVNAADKTPLPLATAFINNTDIANTTNQDGTFILKDVIAGRCRLLVKIIGYQTYQAVLNVSGNINLKDIELTPSNDSLAEVTIKAKPKLSACFPVFETEFFGNSTFARQCKILNPYDIKFYDIDARGGFSARSDKFIEIENDALGYKIIFLLNFFVKDINTSNVYFGGESYFEEMKGTPKQQKEWRMNRLECYQGSMMQLFRSIKSDSLSENGFRIKRASRGKNRYYNKNAITVDPYDPQAAADADAMSDNFGIDADYDNSTYIAQLQNGFLTGKELLLKTNQKDMYAIKGISAKDTSLNSLFIEHVKNIVPVVNGNPVSPFWIWHSSITFFMFINKNKPYLVFNNNGKILNPGVINIDGYMLWQTRVGTMLPYDYIPML